MPPTDGESPNPIFWNEANGVVQDHRDGTIDWEATDRERLKRNLPVMVRPTALDRAIARRDADEKRLDELAGLAKGVREIRGGEDIPAGIIADKELRRDLDALLQKLKALPPSRHRALAITHLEDVIMRLGMDLKRLNELSPNPEPRPYPSSYDPSNTKVEPTADGLKL